MALASLGVSIGGLAIGSLANSTPLVAYRAVPTYFSDDANWVTVKNQAGGISYVIMNPNSGPGAAVDAGWVARLAQLGSQPKMLGYVPTTYAARPLVDVIADIDKYEQWYGVTSIFLDETPWGCSQTAYYASLATYVRANGGVLIMNPGGLPLNCMIDIPDVIVSFENNMQAYLSSTALNPPGYSPQKFWHLIYGAPTGRHREIEELARLRGAGHVYVTSDDLPNPWDGIETFPAVPITATTIVSGDSTTTTTPTTTSSVTSTTVPEPTTTTTTTTTIETTSRTAVPLSPAGVSTTSIARTSVSGSPGSSTTPPGRVAAPA